MKFIFYELNRTALGIAVEMDNADIVKLLLECKDIDVNVINYMRTTYRNEEKVTALHIATSKKNVEIVRLLLESKNIDVNTIGKYYEMYQNCESIREITALHVAIESGNYEIFNILYNVSDININLISYWDSGDYFGHDKYSFLERLGEEEFKKLREKKEKDEKDQKDKKDEKYITRKSLLQIALENDNNEIFAFLYNKTKDVIDDEMRTEIIKRISEYGSIECIKLLLKKNNNDHNLIFLQLAFERKNIEVIKILIEGQIIDINTKVSLSNGNIDCLCFAVLNENVELVKFLLQFKNIDVNVICDIKNVDFHYEPRVLNYEFRGTSAGSSMFRNAPRLDYPQKRKWTKKSALYIVVEKSNVEIIKLLLGNKNIDVNLKDENGKEPSELLFNDEIRSLISNVTK